MITNALITIFNRKLTENGECLIPTVIYDATWYYGRGYSVGSVNDQFIDNSDAYYVRIPYGADTSGKTFIEPFDWKNLEDAQVSEYWTIQTDDIIVRGEMRDTVADQTDIASVTEQFFVVNSFANNTTRGSDLVKHWRIGGV